MRCFTLSLRRYHRRTIHISWHIAAASAAFVAGVSLSRILHAPWYVLLFGIALFALSAGNRSVRGVVGLVLFVVGGCSIGLWHGANMTSEFARYEPLHGSRVHVRGVVSEDVSRDQEGNIRLRIHDIVIDSRSLAGSVWASVPASGVSDDVRRSDVVILHGLLSEGFGTFAATMYRAEIAHLERPGYVDVGRDVRDSFASRLRRIIDEPQASLAAGFIVGQKTALPQQLDDNMRLLGLTHIVVASGYNLSILVRGARKLFMRVSRFSALAGAGLLVFGFMQVTGNSPSMARASAVTGLSLLAWYYGRKIHPFVLLALTSAVTVAINPIYAWGDLGWLLSFTSFVGVMVLAPLLHSYFWGDGKQGFLRQIIVETLSAQVLTLPITLYVFSEYSPLSLPANVLIVPFIPLVMLFGFIGGLAAFVWSPLGIIIAYPAQFLLRYMTALVEVFARLPVAQTELSLSFAGVAAVYGVIIVAIWGMYQRCEYSFRDYNIVE